MFHPNINGLINRQINAEHLLLRYSRFYKPLFLRNFYLLVKLSLVKSKALDFAEFKNKNLIDFWVRTINLLEIVGINYLINFNFKYFYEIIKCLMYLLEKYCKEARKQCRVLTFSILRILVNCFVYAGKMISTSQADHTSASAMSDHQLISFKFFILILKNEKLFEDIKFLFQKSSILNCLLEICELGSGNSNLWQSERNTYRNSNKYRKNSPINSILENFSNSEVSDFNTKQSDPKIRDLLKQNHEIARYYNFYKQKLTQLDIARHVYDKEAAAGGVRMEVTYNLDILENLLQCDTAKIGLSDKQDQVLFHSENFNFTSPDQFYNILKINKPNKDVWEARDRSLIESFVHFCKADKQAFLLNQEKLENFLKNIVKYPSPDFEIQKFFLNLCLIFIKCHNYDLRSASDSSLASSEALSSLSNLSSEQDFGTFIITHMIKIIQTQNCDKNLINLYLDYLPYLLILGSKSETDLMNFVFECFNVGMFCNKPRCDSLINSLKLVPSFNILGFSYE